MVEPCTLKGPTAELQARTVDRGGSKCQAFGVDRWTLEGPRVGPQGWGVDQSGSTRRALGFAAEPLRVDASRPKAGVCYAGLGGCELQHIHCVRYPGSATGGSMAIDLEHDRAVRVAAFKWLDTQKAFHGDVLPRALLAAGFEYQGRRVPIVGPRGIFKPQILTGMPLSLTTIPGGPYDDDLRDGDSVIHYRYYGTDRNHSDNTGVRLALETQTPLIYCYRVMEGSYVVSYPVFVCADAPDVLTFDIQLDDDLGLARYLASMPAAAVAEEHTLHRRYVTTSAKRRLHQVAFRERVLRAYETRCALCRLRHGALLDAAHIIPDGEPGGDPEISNGLALCKIHHAAFDLNYLGITPGFTVEVRPSLLSEVDGPMLQHGIQAMHGEQILLPKSRTNRPSPQRLEARFERFLKATR